MDSCLEPWMMQVVRTIEAEERLRLEGTYGVEIHPDSLPLCCRIITSYFNDFVEASNHEKEQLLKDYMVKLLDVVCHKFICQLHMVAEEDGLDIEYLLHRACIELVEIEKEKDSSTKVWIPHVRKEYADLMDKWHKFEETWKPVLMSQCTPQFRVEELGVLRLLGKELRFYLLNEKATENRDIVSRLLEQLDALRTKIDLSIGKDLKQILTVGPSEIEEATREFFWFPALWTSKFLKPRYQNLETRLAKRFTGQENAIRMIANALTQRQYGKGLIRSFLFVCRCIDCGDEEELARALAEEIFFDKEKLIELDVSENAELNCQARFGVKAELTDAVKKKPYSVVFLQNIDKANASIIDFLLEILRDGRIADENGGIVDFSKTLIIMKLCVLGSTTFKHLSCDCAYKAAKLSPERLEDHDCRYFSLLKDAKQCLRADLFGIIDNVIVFEYHPHQNYRAFARHQLRSMASYIGAGRLILYPSEAALGLIVGAYGMNIHGKIKTWIEEYVASKLLDICDGARMIRSIIYLDVLVGTEEVSYRVETGGYLVGNKEYEQFLANFWKHRDLYEREILWLRKINGLRKTLQMIDGIKDTNASVGLELLADRIEDLLGTETEMNTVLWNLQVGSASNKFAKLQQIEGSKRVYKKEIEVLRTKLYTCLIDGHYVFDTVTRALGSCIDCCIRSQVMVNRPAVFLLLGLTTAGKADLLKDLTKLLVVENGVTLIVQINSSECTDFDKFFNLIYNNRKPVGVLLIDQVEMVPMSVFSGLLKMMERGILSNHGGCTVDLRHNVVILVSDLGNRDTLAQIFGPKSELERKMTGHFESPSRSSWREYMKQPERQRFRSELLNHVDEIVFFNPCVHDGQQMTSFARLPMSAGPHIRQGAPTTLNNSFRQLFHEGDNKREPYYSFLAAVAVDWLSRGILLASNS